MGAGPAGSAAAIRLALAGTVPRLIDQQVIPGDALCGGFLSWATIAQLAELGLTTDQLGGHRITQIALFAGEREERLALPAPGIGLSRHRLDSLLRTTAQSAGAQLLISRATLLSPTDLTLDDGAAIPWDSLFLATGKHDLRGVGRPHGGDDPELGLRLKLDSHPSLHDLIGDRIELHMVDGGYVGLLLQEDGRANICMAVRKSRLAAAEGRPVALFHQLADQSPALAARLASLPADPRIDAIGHVPYGWRARNSWPGLYRLGDQAAVIPSLAGEGTGIAFASAQRAVQRWQAEGREGAIVYQRDFARRAVLPLATAAAVRSLGSHPTLLRALARAPGAAALAMRLTRITPS
ncbi:hypothetical protein [Sphingobium aromaticiconvertens]|uniref:NAD(P)/FAD-dependent oxidoreductase n=1 Tax=Sphingobium aromaticiconvertens TaxID=365341 RepID=UPI00301A78BA